MENQRIRVTKTILKDALLHLLHEKTLDKITVYELCQEAEINRSTFYKYYGSPQDLLEDAEDDFFADMQNNLRNIDKMDTDRRVQALEYLFGRRDTFRALVNAAGEMRFVERLTEFLPASDSINRIFKSERLTEAQKRYFSLFYASGGYAIIRSWLFADDPEPAVEIVRLIEILTNHGAGSL
ncbi:MAG: TetR/AcrR family transcriptional regulator [Oscillospiraceae bacterium]|nr:TetR/AcrR family transcriptional regulator [Oscillospiraceae bacterium]